MTKKKFSFVVIFFLAGIVLAALISTSAVREAYRSRSIETEVESLRQEAKRIQNENDVMTERIAYFQTPQFQEKIAKEKLNLQKPDENVVVVKNRDDQKAEVIGVEDEVYSDEVDTTNYQKWWDAFFKY